jgi:hypothetical protein
MSNRTKHSREKSEHISIEEVFLGRFFWNDKGKESASLTLSCDWMITLDCYGEKSYLDVYRSESRMQKLVSLMAFSYI